MLSLARVATAQPLPPMTPAAVADPRLLRSSQTTTPDAAAADSGTFDEHASDFRSVLAQVPEQANGGGNQDPPSDSRAPLSGSPNKSGANSSATLTTGQTAALALPTMLLSSTVGNPSAALTASSQPDQTSKPDQTTQATPVDPAAFLAQTLPTPATIVIPNAQALSTAASQSPAQAESPSVTSTAHNQSATYIVSAAVVLTSSGSGPAPVPQNRGTVRSDSASQQEEGAANDSNRALSPGDGSLVAGSSLAAVQNSLPLPAPGSNETAATSETTMASPATADQIATAPQIATAQAASSPAPESRTAKQIQTPSQAPGLQTAQQAAQPSDAAAVVITLDPSLWDAGSSGQNSQPSNGQDEGQVAGAPKHGNSDASNPGPADPRVETVATANATPASGTLAFEAKLSPVAPSAAEANNSAEQQQALETQAAQVQLPSKSLD